MNRTITPLRLLAPVAAVVILAGCAGAPGHSRAHQPVATPASAPSASAGTNSMPGMAMPGDTSGNDSATGPTVTQSMVCSDEIKEQVQTVLMLPAPPSTASTFAAGLFTCDYRLPMGLMRLSVQHSADASAARVYLDQQRAASPSTQAVLGLGEQAYATGTGIVFTVKDDETLKVDTTGLPTVFGQQGQKRSDLAYEIASDVLGCWTGDDS